MAVGTLSAFPDAQLSAVSVLADGDMAAIRSVLRDTHNEQVAWFTTGQRSLLRFDVVLRTVTGSPEELYSMADPILDIFLSHNPPFFWADWPPGGAADLADYPSVTGPPFQRFAAALFGLLVAGLLAASRRPANASRAGASSR